jgi:hypothetical protein
VLHAPGETISSGTPVRLPQRIGEFFHSQIVLLHNSALVINSD